jgi:hypothetical protein
VDECHRTESGELHKAMKAILPGVVFIGFTGTPLLKADKQRNIEVFGRYIHTYKFGEADSRLALAVDATVRPAVKPTGGAIRSRSRRGGTQSAPYWNRPGGKRQPEGTGPVRARHGKL